MRGFWVIKCGWTAIQGFPPLFCDYILDLFRRKFLYSRKENSVSQNNSELSFLLYYGENIPIDSRMQNATNGIILN